MIPPDGLRERKKLLTRQSISDTATIMFLEQGFEQVKVADVAAAAGVSEKTVYNYFPTKESLLLDRAEEMADALRAALGPDTDTPSPTQAMLSILDRDLEEIRRWWAESDEEQPRLFFSRFMTLFETTPSLRAAQRDMVSNLEDIAAASLADRAHVSPDDPEPRIAAHTLVGLWDVQWQALHRLAGSDLTSEEILDQVAIDVRRAARIVDSGLWAFDAMVAGRGDREQMRAASEAAASAARQVATAMRHARTAWRQAQQHPDHRHESRAAMRQRQREQHEQWHALMREQHEQWQQVRREMQEQSRQLREEGRRRHR